jgi:serine/threonine protein kinase
VSQDGPGSALQAGQVLDGLYRIDKLLGEGGMGAVYSATHLRLNKQVAIKIMAHVLTSHPESLARFHREAQVTSALGHPHIVQVFDFSTSPTGQPFLVMEFLEGEDLDQRLARVGRLSPHKTVHIVRQVASALSATHAKGIVHRDLKPANIYLLEATGEDDFVKVLDFGISKVSAATSKLTKTSSILGTPRYMSPEQAEGRGEEIDERTDQWALACIAWECLTGQSPFDGENLQAILFKIVSQMPPAMTTLQAGTGPYIEAVLLRALAKRKEERYGNVGVFAAALAAAVDGTTENTSAPRTDNAPLLASETAGPPTMHASPPWPSFFRSRWILGVLPVLAGLLSLTIYLMLRSAPAGLPAAASPSQDEKVDNMPDASSQDLAKAMAPSPGSGEGGDAKPIPSKKSPKDRSSKWGTDLEEKSTPNKNPRPKLWLWW